MTISHTAHRPDVARSPRRWLVVTSASLTGALVLLLTLFVGSTPADAAGPGLASAADYSVLGGSTVTNTGPSVLSGDVGVSPGTAITGFGTVTVGGATHAGDVQAAQAEADLTTAYTVTAGLTPTQTSLGSALVGGVHDPGVYNASSALDLSGAVTLDGQGDPNAVFVFQVGAGFTTASSSSIVLIGAAQACNVFWQVGSSATLGTNTSFVGTIMALTSISLDTGATVQGRALARNGAVTLDDNVFTTPGCSTTTPSTSTSPSSSAPASTLPTTAAAPVTSAAAAPVVVASAPPAVGAGPAVSSAASVVAAAGGSTATSPAATQRAAGLVAAGSSGVGTSTSQTSTALASTGAPKLEVLLLAGVLLLACGCASLAAAGGSNRVLRGRPAHRA